MQTNTVSNEMRKTGSNPKPSWLGIASVGDMRDDAAERHSIPLDGCHRIRHAAYAPIACCRPAVSGLIQCVCESCSFLSRHELIEDSSCINLDWKYILLVFP